MYSLVHSRSARRVFSHFIACSEFPKKSNICNNAVCPGFVDTPMTARAGDVSLKLKKRIPAMHPVGRIATPEEIANAVLYLSSDDSTFTTGSTLVVDGGLTV